MGYRPPWINSRRVAVLAAGIPVAMLVLTTSLLAAADAGFLNGVAKAAFTAKTHRSLSFRHLSLHLLARTPTIEVEDLVVGSPRSITAADLVHIGSGTVQIRLSPLLLGRVEPTSISLGDVDLHMVRLGHGRNNYNFGGAGLSPFLRGVRHLSIPSLHVLYDDPERGLTLNAIANYDSASNLAPLHLKGEGVSHGQTFLVEARGGPLNGRKPGAPYPFNAKLQDGDMVLNAKGASQAPFDFAGFDLSLQAAGPNLADLGYLFNVPSPNSPSFELTAHGRRSGHVVRFDRLKATIGGSDVSGDFTSDHSQAQRRLLANFRSNLIRAEDIAVLLAPRPSHADARLKAGAAPKTGPGLVSAKPFPMDGLRSVDLGFNISAAVVTGYMIPLTDLKLGLQLQRGRLSIQPVSARAGGGRLAGSVILNPNGSSLNLDAQARLSHARLSGLTAKATSFADGVVDASIELGGVGDSPLALLSRIHGRAGVRLHDGVIEKSKATALGGDPFQAGWLSLIDKSATASLSCAAVDFNVKDGIATSTSIAILTSSGSTTGSGSINLAQDTIEFVLRPQAGSKAMTGVHPPIRISGTLRQPVVKADVKQAVGRAGLSSLGAIIGAPLRSLSTSPGGISGCPPLN